MLTVTFLNILKVGENENQKKVFDKDSKPIVSPFKNGGMFNAASHFIFANAKNLRKNMTAAETVLWMHLKKGINDCKFRRQHPIAFYIADFYCHKAKLIIEIDGSIHSLEEVKKKDKEKEEYLTGNGYSVIRFTNKEVMMQIEVVLEKIRNTVNKNITNDTSRIED